MNKEGILQLADDLVHDAKRYNQNTFGAKSDGDTDFNFCGTVACLAGFCLIRKIGITKFNKLIANGSNNEEREYWDPIPVGVKQLGIENEFPSVFGTISSWPLDLEREYRDATSHCDRVIVALKALQRLRVTGDIDPDPKAVHTKLPQLAALLKEKRAQKRKKHA